MNTTFKSLVLSVFLVGCGYNTSEAEVISKINGALNIETPKKFKIINSSSSIAPGDYIEEFEIEFDKEDYKSFMNQIDLKSWKEVGKGYQFTKEINEKTNIIISISKNGNRLRYQYGEI